MNPIIALVTFAFSSLHAPDLQNSPVSAHKTISVHETVSSILNGSHLLKPVLACNLSIALPNRFRCEIVRLPSNEKVHLYQCDGSKEYDFFYPDAQKKSGAYTEGVFADLGVPTNYVGRNFGHIDLILTGKPLKRVGEDASTAPGELEGKQMEVTTTISGDTRITDFVDVETHLPFRELIAAQQDGKWISQTQIDFSDWKFDQPMSPALFAWKEPKGAEYMGKQVVSAASNDPTLTAGTVAPDFVALTPDRKSLRLSSLRGKIVILDFWATWCGPCQASMPHLEKVYQATKNQNVVVLALDSADEQKAYAGWVKKNIGVNYHFPVAFDANAGTKRDIQGGLYHVQGIPCQFIIDKTGMIATVNMGYGPGDHRLEDTLAKLGVTVPSEAAAK